MDRLPVLVKANILLNTSIIGQNPLVALTAGKRVRVYQYDISINGGAANPAFTSGGVNVHNGCYGITQRQDKSIDYGFPLFQTPAGQGLDLFSNVVAVIGISLIYEVL